MAKQSKKDKKSGKKAANDNTLTIGIDTLVSLMERFSQATDMPAEDVDPELDDEYGYGYGADDPDFSPQLLETNGSGFKGVGGIKEIKGELESVVRFLKQPRKFERMGAKLPRGILLQGPPGTGKTLLAKAMAHETGVPFISVSGTEFDVGGAARMRKLVAMAKDIVIAERDAGNKNASCVIYIDDIDVLEDVDPIAMVELARQMDGIKSSDGITVIASTNRPEALDPALLRPGRFDMSLDVSAPDMKGRKEILKIITAERNMPLKADVDFSVIAKQTSGFVGAALDLLVNEAATLAAQKPHARKVGMAEFKQACERALKGPRSYLDISPDEKESTAIHEAGHAIAALRKEGDGMAPLRNVTILPHVGSLGATYFLDEHESYSHTYTKFMAELVAAYGGRIAEELAYGPENVSSGAEGDLMCATEIAWDMVARYGFNEKLGRLVYNNDQDYSLSAVFNRGQGLDSDTARRIYDEMIALTDKAYEEARRILTEDYDALIRLSQALMEQETLDRDEVIAITGIQPGKPKQQSLKQLANRGPKLS